MVKAHKSAVATKEREVSVRETALVEREARLNAIITEKDAEILNLHQLVSSAQIDARIREAVAKREEELRVAVIKREEEVAAAMSRREGEIMNAVRQREQEIFEAWKAREQQIRAEANAAVEDKMKCISAREADLEAEQARLDCVQKDLEAKLAVFSNQYTKGSFCPRLYERVTYLGLGRGSKGPLEDVKNLILPLVQITEEHSRIREKRQSQDWSSLETPVSRSTGRPSDCFPSAMKGVILTETGQPLATPTPAELANLFVNSPRVGLDFAKIFDFEAETEDEDSGSEEKAMPPSPSRRERPSSESSHGSSSTRESTPTSTVPPTRLRKPSIRSSATSCPPLRRAATLPTSTSDPTELILSSARVGVRAKSTNVKIERAMRAKARPTTSKAVTPVSTQPAEYDLSDEENLPSPFLKRGERARALGMGGTRSSKRPSNGYLLRAVAAANSAAARPGSAAKRLIKAQSSGVSKSSGTNEREAPEKTTSRS